MLNKDEKGKFVEGHKVIGNGIQKAIEYNIKNNFEDQSRGGKHLKTEISNIRRSERMQLNHKFPTWDEEQRIKKISDTLKGHKSTNDIGGKKSRRQGINFEYRAKAYMEKQPKVIEVIRSGGSRNIDLTVIWKAENNFLVTKEEVKSSLRWFNSISKNPLTLLNKEDKNKLIEIYNKGYKIFLIYRQPKEKNKGGIMSKQSFVKRIELEIKDNKIIQKI